MQQQQHDACLVIFARLPVPGRVKTRLAASVGAADACELYRACAQNAICAAMECSGWCNVVLSHTEGDEPPDVRAWLASFLTPVRGGPRAVVAGVIATNSGSSAMEAHKTTRTHAHMNTPTHECRIHTCTLTHVCALGSIHIYPGVCA